MSDAVTRLNEALKGSYAIERELGEGGMATVYLADDLKHQRKVALKVLKPELAAVVGAERFLAEIKTTANLTHPHILPLHDSGEADSFLFYVMPHIEGESLRERIDREKQLGVDDSVAITQKVAGALDYAHQNGVVHRDIKHERKVALKVLKPELAAVVGAERFLAEIKTTANLTHPHILPLFDSGEADSFLFYVMPHIEGESLRERIDREKQLSVDDSVAVTQNRQRLFLQSRVRAADSAEGQW